MLGKSVTAPDVRLQITGAACPTGDREVRFRPLDQTAMLGFTNHDVRWKQVATIKAGDDLQEVPQASCPMANGDDGASGERDLLIPRSRAHLNAARDLRSAAVCAESLRASRWHIRPSPGHLYIQSAASLPRTCDLAKLPA